MSSKKDSFRTELESGTPRKIPDSMKKKQAMAFNQNNLAMERTELSKIRTDLAFHNSRLSAEQTHLAYFSFYFIYKDVTTYPRMKRYLDELEQKANELATKAESQVYQIESEEA